MIIIIVNVKIRRMNLKFNFENINAILVLQELALRVDMERFSLAL